MTHVTCRLTAKNRDQLRKPTLGNRVSASFTFTTKTTDEETLRAGLGERRRSAVGRRSPVGDGGGGGGVLIVGRFHANSAPLAGHCLSRPVSENAHSRRNNARLYQSCRRRTSYAQFKPPDTTTLSCLARRVRHGAV